MTVLQFSSQTDADEFERMTQGLMIIHDLAIPDELIEAGFIVQRSIELTGEDGRKWFCTAYVRQEHRVVIAHSTESEGSDVLSDQVIVYANTNWQGLTAHWR